MNERTGSAGTDLISPEEVWSMPVTGIGLIDSNGPQRVGPELAGVFISSPDAELVVPHHEVLNATRELWMTGRVCAFFDDQLARDLRRVNGGRSCADYSWDVALAGIGLFSRTWQGCPEVALNPALRC